MWRRHGPSVAGRGLPRVPGVLAHRIALNFLSIVGLKYRVWLAAPLSNASPDCTRMASPPPRVIAGFFTAQRSGMGLEDGCSLGYLGLP